MSTDWLLVLLFGLGYFAVEHRLFPILQSIHNRLKVIEHFRTEFTIFTADYWQAQRHADPAQLPVPDEFLFPSAFSLEELGHQHSYSSALFVKWKALPLESNPEKEDLFQEVIVAKTYLARMILANQRVRAGLELLNEARADVMGDQFMVPLQSKDVSQHVEAVRESQSEQFNDSEWLGRQATSRSVAEFRRHGWLNIGRHPENAEDQ